MEGWHIWVIIALVFVIVEMFTSGFAVMCISFGCVFGAVASALDWEIKWQQKILKQTMQSHVR